MLWVALKVCGLSSFSMGWKSTAWFTTVAGSALLWQGLGFSHLPPCACCCFVLSVVVLPLFLESCLCSLGESSSLWFCAVGSACPGERKVGQLPSSVLCGSVRHLMNRKCERGGSYSQGSFKPLCYRGALLNYKLLFLSHFFSKSAVLEVAIVLWCMGECVLQCRVVADVMLIKM